MKQFSSNINNSFFRGIYKDAWRKIIPQGLTEAEADFIQDVASINVNKVVLDLMCGYGRHSIELARRGLKVIATDNLKEYIADIDTVAKNEKLDIKTVLDDVVNIDFDEQLFDAVICMGNSFSFFEKAVAISILKNISSHLKPGGVLLINSWMIAEIAIRYFKERDWHFAGDYKCVLEYKYLFSPSRIESEQTIISPKGAVEIIKGIDFIFTLDELAEMLLVAGLKIKELYSTPRKRKFRMGDTQIYIVIEKLNS